MPTNESLPVRLRLSIHGFPRMSNNRLSGHREDAEDGDAGDDLAANNESNLEDKREAKDIAE